MSACTKMSKDVLRKEARVTCSWNVIVQAIRGFLLGFRRGDSVTSKTRALGKTSAQYFLLENPMGSACDRDIEIVFLCFAYKYSFFDLLVLRWVFCADFGCVREITSTHLRVSLVNCLHSQSCVVSDSIAVLDASLSFRVEKLSMKNSGKTDSVWQNAKLNCSELLRVLRNRRMRW